MKNWPVSVIPNALDTNIWQPINQVVARNLLRFPEEGPILLFGAIGGSLHFNKGFDLLVEALRILRSNESCPDLRLVIVGQYAPITIPDFGFPTHYAGPLSDDLALRVHYSAADLLVVPSRIESFCQSASESHACGTPVVAFSTSGLKDVVDDRITGYLAKCFDPRDLAAGISWVLSDPIRYNLMRHSARERAEKLWNPARVAGLYYDVYKQVVLANSSL
jgi:glycosyltransferase involved in cell wall biosynthesis